MELDELSLKIYLPETKKYFDEALTAHRSGAQRSAIILCWISVCVDILEKIKFMAHLGDAEAGVHASKLDGIAEADIAGMQRFENDLLRIAHEELGLISSTEFGHLDRIREDRNKCAHPTLIGDNQFDPLPELARSHISHAATYLLISPPMHGKSINTFLLKLIEGASFPESPDAAYNILSNPAYLGAAREATKRNFIVLLLKKLFVGTDGMSEPLLRRIFSALQAAERIDRRVVEKAINEKLPDLLNRTEDKNLKRFVVWLNVRPLTWGEMPEAAQIRVHTLISKMKASDLNLCDVNETAEKIPDLANAMKIAFDSLDQKEKANYLNSCIPNPILASDVIEIFCSAINFKNVEELGNGALTNFASVFTKENVKNLLEKIFDRQRSYNQIINCSGIDQILLGVFTIVKSKFDLKTEWISFWERAVDETSKPEYLYSFGNALVLEGYIKTNITEPKAVSQDQIDKVDALGEIPF